MADAPQQRHSNPEASSHADREEPASMPTWVKVSGLILGILVLVFAVITLIGGGNHGPSRHATGNQRPPQLEQRASADEAPVGGDPSDRSAE